MLHAELARQQFQLENGIDSWPLVDFTRENLEQVLAIPATFTLSTRKNDQTKDRVVYAVRNLLLLHTVLRSWERRQPWAQAWLEILKNDPELKHQWVLQVGKVIGSDLTAPTLPALPDPGVCHGNHIEALFNSDAPITPIEAVDPATLFDLSRPDLGAEPITLSDEDVDRLVSNIGQEDCL